MGFRHGLLEPWLDSGEPRRPGVDWANAIQEAAGRADGYVFLVRAGAGADREQELEWRSVLRAQWQSKHVKAMIPVIVGGGDLPPFLRDRVPLRLPTQSVNFDSVLDRIVHLIKHPAENLDETARARARIEQQKRLEELKLFA